VIVSAVTHPAMVEILELHGLRAVPVDLDLDTLAPRPESVDAAVTRRTRMILVAHLFGGRFDLAPFVRDGVILVEDCAQCFAGPNDTGDRSADVSLFSFGTIKTATAGGGALACVRNEELRGQMAAIQSRWPQQRRSEYALKVLKLAALLLLSHPFAYELFWRLVPDPDSVVNRSVRGFQGGDFQAWMRRRPGAALIAVLDRRLRRFNWRRLALRQAVGDELVRLLPRTLFHPGWSSPERTHWVFPVVASDPGALIAALEREGFDATRATSAIAAVEPAPPAVADLMQGIVFLPAYPELRDGTLLVLADALEVAVDSELPRPLDTIAAESS
jgi:perosamine synthetase